MRKKRLMSGKPGQDVGRKLPIEMDTGKRWRMYTVFRYFLNGKSLYQLQRRTGFVLLEFRLKGDMQVLSFFFNKTNQQIIYIVSHLCPGLLEGSDGRNKVLKSVHSVETDNGNISSRYLAHIVDCLDCRRCGNISGGADGGGFRMCLQILG